MKKKILGIILTITILCGVLVVPTGEKAEAKSKYQKLENVVLNYKRNTNSNNDYYSMSKYFVQPMSKFNIKIKNLPKGAKTEFRWATTTCIIYDGSQIEEISARCKLYYEGSGDATLYSTYLEDEQMPQQGWIRYKKNSNKSYTVYIKDAIGNPTDYYKNHIYWNQAYWKDVVTAVASYPYEILVTLKDGTQKVFSGCININPIKAQTDYCAIYPLLDDNWFGSYKKSSRNNPIVTAKYTTVEIPKTECGVTEYCLSK